MKEEAGNPRIVLVEDDLPLAETTVEYLQNFGFDVEHIADGVKGAEVAVAGGYDLLLLDLMLPGVDGLEICRRVRASSAAHLPILMLTARGDETDRVVGLELGADDYLTKPFSLRELVARIRAHLRRSSARAVSSSDVVSDRDAMGNKEEIESDGERIEVGSLSVDRRLRTVAQGGESIELTATEFELLWVFVLHPQQVMSREHLLDLVRGREFDVFDRSIDVHISKLRKKLEVNPKKPRLIQTVWGVGYRFVPSGG